MSREAWSAYVDCWELPMFQTCLPRRLWRAFAVNSVVLTAAMVVLAVSPMTVSFPIALAEAVVLIFGLAATLGLNLALLRRVLGAPFDVTPRQTTAPADTNRGSVDAAEHRAPEPADVRRLLVCWTGPSHGCAEGAQKWATTELQRVIVAERIGTARMARLRRASLRYVASHDWLLEVDVSRGLDAQAWLDSPAWAEWLGDLQTLGMQPAAMVAEGGRVLGDQGR